MDINNITTQLMYTTVPMSSLRKNNDTVFCTGIILNIQQSDNSAIPLIVTCYHSLKDSVDGYFSLQIKKDGQPAGEEVKVHFSADFAEKFKLGDLDLVAIPFAGVLNDFQRKGTEIFFRGVDLGLFASQRTFGEFDSIEDVITFGYPNSIYDNIHVLPIARRSYTATPIWNNYKNEQGFLIDLPDSNGFEGSPVFIYNSGTVPTKDGIMLGNRVLFVGIISGKTDGSERFVKVINSEVIKDEVDVLLKKFKQ